MGWFAMEAGGVGMDPMVLPEAILDHTQVGWLLGETRAERR